jgi:hypothetical protein
MRESQMKKIIAAAVASAFIAPAFAADVSLTGSVEFNMDDNNGTTTANTDSAFKVSASTETANGISVTAAINIQANSDGTDAALNGNGGDGLTLAGDFGKIELGDASSAADKYDDRGDFSKLNGVATSAGDAQVGWTLPALVDGASVYVSFSDDAGEGDAHTGLAVQYAAGPVTLAYAQNDEVADNSDLTYVGASVSLQGLTLSAETMEDEGGGTKEDEKIIGVKYAMGDITVFAASYEHKTSGSKDEDVMSYGLHYSLGGGVTAFVETQADDLNDAADSTGFGLEMTF